MQLSKTLQAWNTPAFNQTFKDEVEQLDGNLLPLQQGLARSSYAVTDGFQVVVLDVGETADCIRAKVGIAYRGIIAGCSCADDPTSVDELPEYCQLQFDIDKHTAATTVTLLDD